MDAVTAQRLARADRQIVEGIGLVIKQREVILDLERAGMDASSSHESLSAFVRTLREFVDYRDKLLQDWDPAP